MFNLKRLLIPPKRSFFLFGPRGVGKSTWISQNFPKAIHFNLLDETLFYELSRSPENLAARIAAHPKMKWVCIDEIQRLPGLLNEVHRLMEAKKLYFVLTGSSARKLRKGGVNLLAGRAITREMRPFVSNELEKQFDLNHALQYGLLPLVCLYPDGARDTLTAYVHTYLQEEIRQEGIVRRIEPFARFLEVAGLINAQQLNMANIARDCGLPRNTVESYFHILIDTLLGDFLKPYRPGLKVREKAHPKFYWFDSGVARTAAGLLHEEPDSSWLGSSLETLILHELKVYNHVMEKHRGLFYYRTAANIEIDFIIELKKKTPAHKPEVIALEVKNSKKWDRKWERAIRDLNSEGNIHVKRMIGVYRGTEKYNFQGFEVYPVSDFLNLLHSGKLY